MRRVFLLVALVCALSTAGCHRQVTVSNVPAGVSQTTVQNWYATAGAFQLGGKYVQQLVEATISLHSKFPDETTYQATLAALGRASQTGIQASQYLETVPQNWNQDIQQRVLSYLNDFSKQVQGAITDGLAHVKNSNSVSTLQNTITLLQGVIKTLQAIVTPATTVGRLQTGSVICTISARPEYFYSFGGGR